MDVYKQLDLRDRKCKFNLKLIHKVNSHCYECKPNDYVNKKHSDIIQKFKLN